MEKYPFAHFLFILAVNIKKKACKGIGNVLLLKETDILQLIWLIGCRSVTCLGIEDPGEAEPFRRKMGMVHHFVKDSMSKYSNRVKTIMLNMKTQLI